MTRRSGERTWPRWTRWSSTPRPAAWSSPTRPSWCARRSTPSWSIPAPARTRAIPRRWISRSSPGWTASPPRGCASRTSTTSSAPTCTSTIAAGTPGCVNGRWVPTFPKAKYIFHKREYAAWEEATARGDQPAGQCLALQLRTDGRGRPGAAGRRRLRAGRHGIALQPTPGHAPCHCCVNIRSGGQRAVGDRRPDAPRAAVREPDWSTIFDWDPKQAAASRRKFLGEVADTAR